MARFLKYKKEAIGLSPDAMHFSGEQKVDSPRIRLIDFNLEELKEAEAKSISQVKDLDGSNTTSWLNIDGLHDIKTLKDLADTYHIESLILANILDTHSRPKIHEYDNCIFISTKMLHYNELNDQISSENFVMIIKENLLITFQERVGDVFNPIRERIRKSKKRIRSSKTDYLAFALLDIIIDNYIYIISRLGEKIEDLDDELIADPSSKKLSEINKFKSEISYLRKIIKPCREMILNFAKLESDLISEQMPVHIKELQSNIELANESVDSYREILSDQLNIFHTNVSYKLNDILKFLTIFSVIFIPITFIAGIYGTNFDNIPELHYKYGYFVMWAVILSSVSGMIYFFKKKKWF
jgi:magnesium transporter